MEHGSEMVLQVHHLRPAQMELLHSLSQALEQLQQLLQQLLSQIALQAQTMLMESL